MMDVVDERACCICNKRFHSKEPYFVIAEMDNIKDSCKISKYLCPRCYRDIIDSAITSNKK